MERVFVVAAFSLFLLGCNQNKIVPRPRAEMQPRDFVPSAIVGAHAPARTGPIRDELANLRDALRRNPNSVSTLVALGERLLAESSAEKRAEGERLLERAALLNPNEPRATDALRQRLTASARINDWRKLRAKLVRVKTCPPGLLLEHAQDLLAHRLHAEARAVLVVRSDLTDRAADLLLALATAHEALGEPLRAATALSRAAGELPASENADSLRLRAALLYIDGRDARAAIRLLAYVDSPKLKPVAMAYRGDAYRALGEWKAAAAEYREALRIEPTNGAWFAALADALGKAGDTKGMRNALASAQRHGVDSTNIRLTLGQEALRSGDTERAIDVFRKAALADPKSAEAATMFAYSLERGGRARDAEAEYHRALVVDPAAKDARVNLAILLGKRGDFSAQRTVLEQGLKSQDDSRLRMLLGSGYAAEGDRDRAREEFSRAARLDRKDPKPLIELARIDQAAGKADDAIRHYRAALAADPSQAFAREQLIKLLEASGDKEEAESLKARAEALR